MAPAGRSGIRIGKKAFRVGFQPISYWIFEEEDTPKAQRERREEYRKKIAEEFKAYIAEHMKGRSSQEMFRLEDVARKFRDEYKRPEMNTQRVALLIHQLSLQNASIRTTHGTLISFNVQKSEEP